MREGLAEGVRRARGGRVASAALAAVLLLAAPSAAAAGGPLSEVRAGVLNHDLVFPNLHALRLPEPFSHRFERGVALNLELLFTAPDLLGWAGAPRPRVGGSVAALGGTNYAYADLVWSLARVSGVFIEGYLGGAVHDGRLLDGDPPWLGSRLLFHLGLEVGVRAGERAGLSLMWDHISNSALAARNQGMDSLGLRVGWRLD